MSLPYWLIAGLGISMKRLFPYLQAQKVRKLMLDQEGIDLNTKDAAYWEKINDIERFKLLYEYFMDDSLQFADLLAESDDKHLLSFGNDSDGNGYLYFAPSYPWERKGAEFHSKKDAKKYICNVVMPFVNDQVSKEDIMNLIGEIYEVGIEIE